MELINQHAKGIMEACKKRARDAGLIFDSQTLEYLVTNSDMIKLDPKIMIPTLYDFWIHDLDVIKGKGIYSVNPHNPYETVINTRPAISFYNDNNRDWVNTFIFYHVLGHIDCFQNNVFFEKTWDDDFCNKALSDKKVIAGYRKKEGPNKRWVDYVIEFSRAIDNIVGFYSELDDVEKYTSEISKKLNFYLDIFLKKHARVENKNKEYLAEIERYNALVRKLGKDKETEIEKSFFGEVVKKYPEVDELFEEYKKKEKKGRMDVMQYVMENSDILNKPKNKWKKQVMSIIRDTSLFFQPQIRTKIVNEGWASYCHENLFLGDPAMSTHEVDFAKLNSAVVTIPRVGMNPYGLGLRLLEFIYDLAEKGKLDYGFQQEKDIQKRKNYDKKKGKGKETLLYIRKYMNDQMLFNFLSEKDFQDFVNKHRLFVAGKRIEWDYKAGRPVWKYFVKSRNGEDYRKMVLDSLYHPPYVVVNEKKARNSELYLDHKFEGRQLVPSYIPMVLRGLAYLWGKTVKLETTIFEVSDRERWQMAEDPNRIPKYTKRRIVYTITNYRKEPTISNL